MRLQTLLICIVLLLVSLTITQAQTTESCPSALPHQLVDAEYGVIKGDGLRMRDNPTLGATLITQLPEGQAFSVLAGPTCADGYTWWQITADEVTGWVVQGSDTEYWLARVDTPAPEATAEVEGSCPAGSSPQFTEGDRIHAVDNKRVNVRDASSLDGVALGQVTDRDFATVVGALPECTDDQVWWLVDLNGTLGWVLESINNDPLIQIHRYHSVTPLDLTPAPFTRYELSEGGTRIAVGNDQDNEVRVYENYESDEPILMIPDARIINNTDFELSADGDILAIISWDKITLWDIDENTEIGSLPEPFVINLTIKRVADGLLTNAFGDSVRVVDEADLTTLWEMDGIDNSVAPFHWHLETNQVVAIQSPEIYLATIGEDDTTLIESPTSQKDTTCTRFHPSGDSILLAQHEGQMSQVFLDDSAEPRVIQTGVDSNPSTRTCAISNNGRYFAVTYRNDIYMWDLETDAMLVLEGHEIGRVTQMQFTADDLHLLSATTVADFFKWDLEQLLRNPVGK